MDRSEALRQLRTTPWTAPDGSEECTVGCFEPADAEGIARLFYAVYGEGYPVDTYYIPERLIDENARGAVRSAVARTASGDVVAHVAFYRSSPPNPKLYEYGLGLTLPSYRSSLVFSRACQAVLKLLGTDDIDGIFGESVCNHVITQKLSLQAKMVETALEPALMPADAYTTEHSAQGRVACVMFFRFARDQRRVVFLPRPYLAELEFMMSGLGLDREVRVSQDALPAVDSVIEVARFASAGVARCTIKTAGHDLAARLAELESEWAQNDYALIQVFVDLGQASCGAAVDELRRQAYSLGGFLPAWFGDDGLLLQKHRVSPDFENIKLYTDRARALLEIVRRDWQRAQDNG
ncbi:MAG: hypothetical protein H6R17_971 [Proteobacteria bacterium]|nr:hypothetical protein [Pseudomonadota bacterium]